MSEEEKNPVRAAGLGATNSDNTGPIWAASNTTSDAIVREMKTMFGKNGVLRAGIAGDKEDGLASNKFVMIPILDGMWEHRHKLAARGRQGFFFDVDGNHMSYVSNTVGKYLSRGISQVKEGDITVSTKSHEFKYKTDEHVLPGAGKRDIPTIAYADAEVKKDESKGMELTVGNLWDIVEYADSYTAVGKKEGYYDVQSIVPNAVLAAANHDRELDLYGVGDAVFDEHLKVIMGTRDIEKAKDLAAILTYFTAQFNFDFLKTMYAVEGGTTKLEDEIIKTFACAVSTMYATGQLEASNFTTSEFCWVRVKVNVGTLKVKVVDIEKAANATINLDTLKKDYNLADILITDAQREVGSGAVVLGALNHYGTNHSVGNRGGNALVGKFLRNSGLAGSIETIKEKAGRFGMKEKPADAEKYSMLIDALYNVIHPANKRGLACQLIEGSNVHTYAQPLCVPGKTTIELDTFTSVRRRATPAGTAMGYATLIVIKHVSEAGVVGGLPWYGSLSKTITLAYKLTGAGAENHVGARYYTDRAPAISQQGLSQQLNDLAYWAQNMMAGSSLANSPHLSMERAASAAQSWKSLVDTLKVSVVGQFDKATLAKLKKGMAAGSVDLDLSNDEGIQKAITVSKSVAVKIAHMLGE